MRERSLGISISLLFHIIVVVLLLRVPLDQFIKSKSIVIDFTLKKGQMTTGGQGTVNSRAHKADELHTGNVEHKEAIEKTEPMTRPALNKQMHTATDYTVKRPDVVDRTASDETGQVLVQDEKMLREAKSGIANEKGFPAGQGIHGTSLASGNGKMIDYNKGGADAKDFPFITEVVQKRFKDKYPDRARRMGWEGRVLLAFVIMENGTIHDVEVINSSGRRVFDDHAREILEKTTFNKQLPYKLQIKNWLVTYRLQ